MVIFSEFLNLYTVESGYIAITTEVEWLQSFGVSNSPYWIIGDRLCEWTLKLFLNIFL